MKETREERNDTAESVQRAKQGGEPAAPERKWGWVEPTVWTERMLTALDNGVKGGKWYSLIDKVCSMSNLKAAFERVQANGGAAGVDNQTIEMYERRLESNLERLARELKEGKYQPQAVKRVLIPKPGKKNEKRPLGIPTVRDRIVQTALRSVMEPIFEKEFADQSYGFRPGRGCKDALRRVNKLLQERYQHVVDADLKSYFDTIPHEALLERVEEKVSDGRVIGLVESFMKAGIMEGDEEWEPEAGTPQGAVISPLLSNIYLTPLDKLMESKGYQMVRYADDFVILSQSQEAAEEALKLVQEWVAEASLKLHPEKTRIVDVREGSFDFLGYRFGPKGRWVRDKSLKKLKDTIRSATHRANGHSLEAIIKKVNQTTRGWFEYFKHARWYIFDRLDAWIRARLRAILRKRRGGRGVARGADHQRWPNAFFAERGLFSMMAAFKDASQSATR